MRWRRTVACCRSSWRSAGPASGDHAPARMALKSTICKAELGIADIDRGYYRDHALTIARHPSETDERMMVRVLAFALGACMPMPTQNMPCCCDSVNR